MAKQSKTVKTPEAAIPTSEKKFTISYPVLWLALAVILLYAGVTNFGFTELDDSIFIRDFQQYNENISNLATSFHRGVFDAANDTYYRPLFLDSMLLNYQLSEQSPIGYHVVNLLFHLLSVTLLYQLFRRLSIKQWQAFALTLLFAVHPVLAQAVAWIPGRNDTMLAIFLLSFWITALNYTETGKIKWLALSILALLLAFFTKETAVFGAPVAFVLLVMWQRKNWLDKKLLIQYGSWITVFLIWLGVRSAATLKSSPLAVSQIAHDFFGRLPLIVQYIGKIFLPFNLSVFPVIEDTVYYYGIAAIVLLALIIFLTKNKDARKIAAGLTVFALMLLPVLIVPKSLNEQTFEHRLYLPVIGILMIIPQTILMKNNWNEKKVFYGFLAVAVVFCALNYRQQQFFSDPLTFWKEAQRSSPHSAYATMMYGARMEDPAEGAKMFRKAYTLNPKEKYLNYYYGVMLQKEDSVLQSEPYLLAEKKISNYYECDFYLARVAMEKKDMPGAISYLEHYIVRDPNNPQANNNLLLLYLDTRQKAKADAQVKHMTEMGMAVPAEITTRIGQMN
ncbi:glycosyltransferase family 39 protein [Taibaiella soli]|uniref:Tetratricopeptide repeat protein n=1 Tax=Taibaiella soli TaxID=1649169 RepID=A0A2W2B3L2_9BACT|nr:glycosyltransferase family 39 protein [Taibaiella soli]PZF74894.1 tetratricopeptide repeat protein [Taibaiella soli]